MDEFEARAGAYISQHQMLQKGDTVIVALSGGADSMALFHFLFSVQNVWGGAAADGDAAFVRAQCAARGVPLDETLLSPPENAGEEWGRQERYAFFARLAQAHGAKVATAHTCSDNAETVLFNLARGSAARGAAGIPPVRGPYVRPLLWAQRADVLRHGAGPVHDEHVFFLERLVGGQGLWNDQRHKAALLSDPARGAGRCRSGGTASIVRHGGGIRQAPCVHNNKV